MNGGGRFALVSSSVVTPDGVRPAVVVVNGERIEAILPRDEAPSDVAVTDFGDLVMAPGVVDAHVHVNEPGRTEWEGFETATRAAAAGGVTTIVDMPLNSSPVTTTVGALEEKRSAAAGKCLVDVGFYGGLIPGNAKHLEPLVNVGVCGVKAFMCDSGLDAFPAASLDDLRTAMPLLAQWGVPLLVHAELPTLENLANSAANSMTEFAAQRHSWEANAVLKLIELQVETTRAFGVAPHLHIVHFSDVGAVAHLRDIRSKLGKLITVTAETCPHYLTFCHEEIEAADARYKCAPPIYDAANRDRLWLSVSDGTIDTIGSDHSPCPPEMKAGGFAQAWGGISSLQLTLPLMWTGFQRRGLPLERMYDLLAKNPARLIGFDHRKGQLVAGFDADVCIWDPDAEWTIRGEDLHHRHKLTPYEGMNVRGQVKQTYLRGRLAYDDGEFPIAPAGKLLRRS